MDSLFNSVVLHQLFNQAALQLWLASMNILDWVLAAIMVFCIVRGLLRGAITQIFGIAGVLGGFLLAAHFYEGLAMQLLKSLPFLPQPQIIGFGIIFALSWFCLSLLGHWVSSFFHRRGMGCLDRLLGGTMGFGKAFIIAVIMISIITFFCPSDTPLLRESRLAPSVQNAAHYLLQVTPLSVQQLFDKKHKELKDYWFQQN